MNQFTRDLINRPYTILIIVSLGLVIASTYLLGHPHLTDPSELHITNAIANAMFSLGVGLFFAGVFAISLIDILSNRLAKRDSAKSEI